MSRKPGKRPLTITLDMLSKEERQRILEKFDRELEESSKKGASS